MSANFKLDKANSVSSTPKSRSARMKNVDTPRTKKVKEQLNKNPYLPAMDSMPAFLRFGPWSPAAIIFLICFVLAMIYYYPSAQEVAPNFEDIQIEQNTWSGIWRFMCFIYGVVLVALMCMNFAWWPLLSFTMISWNQFTIRYLCNSLMSFGFDWYSLKFISEVLRFPTLVFNSITVSVWWLILVPGIMRFMPSEKARAAFMKFNKSAMLINVHLLNLPFAAMDHLTNPRILNFFDLYVAILFALIYVLFYLFVMDPMGMHFYHVLLSPRPHWSPLCYIFCLALFVLYWYAWNWLGSLFHIVKLF